MRNSLLLVVSAISGIFSLACAIWLGVNVLYQPGVAASSFFLMMISAFFSYTCYDGYREFKAAIAGEEEDIPPAPPMDME